MHGRAPVVSTAQAQGRQHIRGVLAGSKGLAVVVERLDVPEILDGGERDVGHTQLFALVDVRGAAM